MANRKLGRPTDQRQAILGNLTTALIWNGRIETTQTRAKEVRSIAEKIITLAVREYDNTVEVQKAGQTYTNDGLPVQRAHGKGRKGIQRRLQRAHGAHQQPRGGEIVPRDWPALRCARQGPGTGRWLHAHRQGRPPQGRRRAHGHFGTGLIAMGVHGGADWLPFVACAKGGKDMHEAVRCEAVVYAYGAHNALSGLNLSITQGEYVAVAGRNGSGKSTLARHVNALLTPQEGRVVTFGLDTSEEANVLPIRQRAGMVFQNPDNQIVASVVEEDVAFGPENLGVPSEQLRRGHGGVCHARAAHALGRAKAAHRHRGRAGHATADGAV